MAETLIGIATYNEIDSLPRLLPRLLEETKDCDVLIVDDDSPDGTGDWVETQQATDDRIHLMRREGKLGLGTATLAVLRYAIEHDYQYCVTMDADLSHDPKYLPAMRSALEQPTPVDVVIGSRYVPGGGVEGWPLRRRIMSRMINAFARWWLRIQARDTSGAFRIYRIATLNRLELASVRSTGYSVFEELLYRLAKMGVTVREVPIVFVDRDVGQSKITMVEAIQSVWRLVTLRLS